MPYADNLITAPVGLADIATALGTTSLDLGTLCTHRAIKEFAKYKPEVYSGSPAELSLANRQGEGYSIQAIGYQSQGVKNLAGWQYLRPSLYYRALDFSGYYSAAPKRLLCQCGVAGDAQALGEAVEIPAVGGMVPFNFYALVSQGTAANKKCKDDTNVIDVDDKGAFALGAAGVPTNRTDYVIFANMIRFVCVSPQVSRTDVFTAGDCYLGLALLNKDTFAFETFVPCYAPLSIGSTWASRTITYNGRNYNVYDMFALDPSSLQAQAGGAVPTGYHYAVACIKDTTNNVYFPIQAAPGRMDRFLLHLSLSGGGGTTSDMTRTYLGQSVANAAASAASPTLSQSPFEDTTLPFWAWCRLNAVATTVISSTKDLTIEMNVTVSIRAFGKSEVLSLVVRKSAYAVSGNVTISAGQSFDFHFPVTELYDAVSEWYEDNAVAGWETTHIKTAAGKLMYVGDEVEASLLIVGVNYTTASDDVRVQEDPSAVVAADKTLTVIYNP